MKKFIKNDSDNIRTLSNPIIAYIQCPRCRNEGRDNSRDNLAVNADGAGYCFAGHGFVHPKILRNILRNQRREDILGYIFPRSSTSEASGNGTKNITTRINKRITKALDKITQGLTQDMNQDTSTSTPLLSPQFTEYPSLDYREWRGVKAETMKFFDVKSNDELIIYPWGPSARLLRRKASKDFWWEGQARESQGLFGMDKFVSGHGFVVTITEGALDAMSLWQALGGKYPVVSVKSAASALADCSKEFGWLNEFDKIKLALDWDKPGQDAAAQIARLFDINKVYWVRP
jgi:hypothetical protein